MSALSTLKSLFNSRRQCEVGLEDCHSIESTSSCKAKELSIEAEVNFIKDLLEKKFNAKFQARVRVDGYLGEDLYYSLVIDDYCNHSPPNGNHSIYGYKTKNILDVRKEFLKAYWDNIEEVDAIRTTRKELDAWDAKRIARYKETAVASSHEELLIRAEMEGVEP